MAAVTVESAADALTELASLSSGAVDLCFVLCIEIQDGEVAPFIAPIHGIGGGAEGSPNAEAPIYAWASETVASQVPPSIRVNPDWLVCHLDAT